MKRQKGSIELIVLFFIAATMTLTIDAQKVECVNEGKAAYLVPADSDVPGFFEWECR